MSTYEEEIDDQRAEQQSILESGQACDPPGRLARFRDHLADQVDQEQATGVLAAYCFMTGFLDSISVTNYSVWVGFQTGNFTTLAIAVARMITHVASFQNEAAFVLVSLCGFNFGAFCARIGDSGAVDNKSRGWLFGGTIVQAALTAIAAICVTGRQAPLWAVGYVSASLGLQGVMAKRLNSQLSTTVVLTALWCDLMTDPDLFSVPFRRAAVLRDHKLFALVCLFWGACVGYILLDNMSKHSTAGALGMGAGLRLLIAIGWLFVPAKKGIFLP